MREDLFNNHNVPNGARDVINALDKRKREDRFYADAILESDPFQRNATESLEQSGARLREVIVQNNSRLNHI
ncbi:hypothetical protein KBB27_03765, partial [Patescibacteria group bacterium]|nr:hypothetical protein [Patescibacteria group bacterium]